MMTAHRLLPHRWCCAATLTAASRTLINKLPWTQHDAFLQQMSTDNAFVSEPSSTTTTTTDRIQNTALGTALAKSISGQHALLVTSYTRGLPLRYCSRYDVARLLGISVDHIRVRWSRPRNTVPEGFFAMYPDKESRDQAAAQMQLTSPKLGWHPVHIQAVSQEEVIASLMRITNKLFIMGELHNTKTAAVKGEGVQPTGPLGNQSHVVLVTANEPINKDKLLQAYLPLDLVQPYVMQVATGNQSNQTDDSSITSASLSNSGTYSYYLYFASGASAVRAACDTKISQGVAAAGLSVRTVT